MIRVLNITEILPHPEIPSKINENDIILQVEEKLSARYSDIYFQHIFILPRTNRLLALFSHKWSSFYRVQKSKSYSFKGRKIYVFGVIQLPRKTKIRNFLYYISFLLNRRRINNIISNFKPTVIHAQNTDVDAYIARMVSQEYNIPYVLTLRGLSSVSDSKTKINIEKSTHVIALSYQQQIDASKLSRKEVHFIPHGISREFFIKRNDKERRTHILKLVSVCRLISLKNLDKVIESLSQYKHDFIYDIYGDGPEKYTLEEQIKRLSLSHKIKLKGRVLNEQLPNILSEYDVFIMPSKPETFGRVYLEAMACGLPVIASKDTGIDGIISDRKEGFLVDHSNPRSLNEILDLLGDRQKLQNMGGLAQELAESFSWEVILPKIYRLYRI